MATRQKSRTLAWIVAGSAGLLWAAPTPAIAEIVSKLPGPEGLPFPGQFVDATPDGRYVLLKVTAPAGVPEPSGPEADTVALQPYVLRDRVADTTTRLDIRLEPGGPTFYATPTQISDDGDRVLFESGAEELLAFTGNKPVAVFDRSESRVLKLPSTPGASSGYLGPVQLSADGNSVLVRMITPYGSPAQPELWRGPVGGVGSVVTNLPGLGNVDATDDLQTIVYTRSTPAAARPDMEPGRTETYSSRLIGVIQGDAAPRIVSESSHREKRADGSTGTCINSRDVVSQDIENGYEPRISPNGSRIGWYESFRAYGADPLDIDGWLKIRAATGTTSQPFLRSSVVAFGNANFTRFDYPDPYAGWTFRREELVKGETELIASGEPPEYGGEGPGRTRYTEATPYAGAPVPPFAPLTFTDEPIDTPNRPAAVTWYSCPAAPADAPVGAFEDYVQLSVASRLAAAYQMGNVLTFLKPSSAVREATKVTVELTAFGVPLWRKSVATSTFFNLPKPLAYLPQTLRVTVQPKAVPGKPAPAPIVRTRSIYTTKFE